jgi:hypothetical protein
VPTFRLPVLSCALLLAGAVLCPQLAAACSQVAPEAFEIDRSLAGTDQTAPTPFRGLTASTRRIAGEHCKNGICINSSCGDTGYIELRFEPPRDHADGAQDTESSDLGYRVVWLGGKMPEAMRDEIGVLRPLNAGPSLTVEAGFAGITELDVELALVAVDRAGNESAPSEPVHVQWSGCTEYFDEPMCAAPGSNCGVSESTSRPVHAGLWVWMTGVLVAVGIRWRFRNAARMR